jgi:glycosyltransferase involved in cell wall biosynthesis
MTRLLMTVDAAGGVWRYAMDLARGLRDHGVETAFLGFGPRPKPEAEAEALALGPLDWAEAPLDWMATGEVELGTVAGIVADMAARSRAHIVQVNVPSQAAHLPKGMAVVAVHHSCVATWYRAVKGMPPPAPLAWHTRLTRAGLRRADAIVAPSVAHGKAVAACCGTGHIKVVPNAVEAEECEIAGAPFVAGAGRWWDEGKGGATLDAAAAATLWPVVMAGPVAAPDGTFFAPRHASATGPLPHAAATALIRSAGIFASASLYEPFGLAVAEAARAARPLVLSDIPTFRELWGDAALYVAPGDPEALAATVNCLAADPMLRRMLGRAAQARARRFTVTAQARAMADLYGHVLGRRAVAEAG